MYLKSQKDISHSLHNGMVDVFHCIMMPEFIRHGPAVFAVCFFPQLSEHIDYPLSGITAAHCILKKLCFPRINFPYFPVVLFQQFCHATVEGHIMLGVSLCFTKCPEHHAPGRLPSVSASGLLLSVCCCIEA